MNDKAKYFIQKLGLLEHPEGGYYKEIYRSDDKIKSEYLPARYNSDRTFSTSIYFMLESSIHSTFHSLQSDELWHFYDGTTLKIYIIGPDGKLNEILLGRNLESGEVFQCVIPKHTWFAAEVIDKDSFTLVGCSVAPGFDFEDFEIGNVEKLCKQFPQHSDLIKRLAPLNEGLIK